jgi:hypothetical protein
MRGAWSSPIYVGWAPAAPDERLEVQDDSISTFRQAPRMYGATANHHFGE